MHLDAERIQRVLHRELSSGAATTAHLAGCEDCRAAVARARAEEGEVFALLSTLDHPRRAADIGRVHRAARPRRSASTRGGSYEVRIPRAAPRVEIQVAGVRVWLKEGERIVSDRSPGADGVTRIPLAR